MSETHGRQDGNRPAGFPLWSVSPWRGGPGAPKHGIGVFARDDRRHRFRPVREHAGTVMWFVLDEALLVCAAYLPPSASDDEIQEWLTPPPEFTSLPTVVAGDLNARFGSVTEDAENVRGGWLLSFFQELDLQLVPCSSRGATFMSSLGHRSVIDHVFTNLPPGTVRVDISEAERGGSDHFFLVARISPEGLRVNRSATVQPAARLRMSRFRAPEFHEGLAVPLSLIHQRHAPLLDTPLSEVADPQGTLDGLESEVTSAILSAAEAMCGRTTGQRRPVKKPPQVVEALRACRRVEKAVASWNRQTAVRVPAPPALLEALREAHARRVAAVEEWTEASWEKFFQEVQSVQYNDALKRLATVLRKRKRASYPLANSQESMDAYATHMEKA
ncbi:MAG TPA: hypothetical protein PLZ61_07720, partial [Candidatus Cryosericum sp.]|nr:hypothetical protein [Candidatus Cryosericum sp.]